ncbi:MAG: nucleoside triphosphate pyrophosphohydrolase, partial [Duncaniella sp.]|nr:nucleoside triphosphate pyrophosphohydrolase [Duncaniella sp.]
WEKVGEEIAEFAAAAETRTPAEMEEEMGDVLFAIINASRLYGINSENALEKTNAKFIRRFNHIESRAREAGRDLRDMTLAEMDELWNEAKKLEREG